MELNAQQIVDLNRILRVSHEEFDDIMDPKQPNLKDPHVWRILTARKVLGLPHTRYDASQQDISGYDFTLQDALSLESIK